MPWQYDQRSPRPADPCLPLPTQVSLRDLSLAAGGAPRARSSVSTSGLSTGSHGREGPGKGEGRLATHSQCAARICPTRPAAAEPLAPGDTGLDPGPSAPSIPPLVSAKTPCFLHTVDASALAQLTLNPAPCAVGHAAHQGLPLPPASLTAFPGGQAGQGAPACLPSPSHRASRLRLPKPHSGVLPAP